MTELNMKKNMTRGKLITFCGLDGSGKTTQIKLLRDHFANLGQDVFLTRHRPTASDSRRYSGISSTMRIMRATIIAVCHFLRQATGCSTLLR